MLLVLFGHRNLMFLRQDHLRQHVGGELGHQGGPSLAYQQRSTVVVLAGTARRQ
ncbi:hypothetical protein D3C76_1790990 [compost metagenome]